VRLLLAHVGCYVIYVMLCYVTFISCCVQVVLAAGLSEFTAQRNQGRSGVQ
jgi:hypothetical protein